MIAVGVDINSGVYFTVVAIAPRAGGWNEETGPRGLPGLLVGGPGDVLEDGGSLEVGGPLEDGGSLEVGGVPGRWWVPGR